MEDANAGCCPPASSGPSHVSETLRAWAFPAAGPHLSVVLDPTALSSWGCALYPDRAELLSQVRLWGQRGGRAARGTVWAPATRPPLPFPFGHGSPARVPREAPASLSRDRGQPVLRQPPPTQQQGPESPGSAPAQGGGQRGAAASPKTPPRALHSGWREGGGIGKGPWGPPGGLGSHGTPCPCPQGLCLAGPGEQLLGPKSLGDAEAVPMLQGSALVSQLAVPPLCPRRAGGGPLCPQLGPRAQIDCGLWGSGTGRDRLVTKWKHMWEEPQALLFYGISRKGWRSESESRISGCAGAGGAQDQYGVVLELALCSDGTAESGFVGDGEQGGCCPGVLARGPVPCFLLQAGSRRVWGAGE